MAIGFADVAAVGGRAEEPERAIVGAQTGEQHDRAPRLSWLR